MGPVWPAKPVEETVDDGADGIKRRRCVEGVYGVCAFVLEREGEVAQARAASRMACDCVTYGPFELAVPGSW